MTAIRRFLRDDGGATAIEYALVAGLIFVAILTGVKTAGDTTLALFTRVETGMK